MLRVGEDVAIDCNRYIRDGLITMMRRLKLIDITKSIKKKGERERLIDRLID